MEKKSGSNKLRMLVNILVALGILALGAMGLAALTLSKPKMEKAAPEIAAPPARVARVEAGSVDVRVTGEGTAEPIHEISLTARAAGEIETVSESFRDGGSFHKGDVLVTIDKSDYEAAVLSAQASVKQAQSNYLLAAAETKAAREEWKKLHGGGGRAPALVAKTPQLSAALAALESAKASLAQAELNLARTEVKAPFDGRVSKKNVGPGQNVTVGQALAVVYSTAASEIAVPLDDEAARWLDIPGLTVVGQSGSRASVTAEFLGMDARWEGVIDRAQGRLDESSRLVGVVVRVDRPFDRLPPLAPGLYVRVEFQGRTIEDAAVIPREALRLGDIVWVIDAENRLHFRKVEVARMDGDRVVVRSGLADGELVTVTNLRDVTDGMLVRPVTEADERPEGDATPGSAIGTEEVPAGERAGQ